MNGTVESGSRRSRAVLAGRDGARRHDGPLGALAGAEEAPGRHGRWHGGERAPADAAPARSPARRVAPAHVALAIVLLACLLAKLAAWAWTAERDPTRFVSSDTGTYHRTALALLEYGTYAYSLETPRTPEIVRTPGYPTFLAGAYLVLGRSQVRAVLLQLLVSVLTVALVYRVARLRWGSSGAGLAAALFAALDVVSFVYALRLLTETLAAFCQALLLLAAFRAWRRIDDRWSPLLLGGALTAVTLMRPTTYYLVVPMAAWIALLALRDHLGARRTARAVGLFVLPFVLVIGGWAARNWAWTGYFEYSFITGMNMLFYKGAGVIALRDGISLGEAQQKVGRTSYHDVPHEDRPELFVRYRKEAAELLAAHPWLYLRVVADGVHDTLLDHGGHHLFHVLALGPKERGAFARPVVRFASRYLLVLYACIAVCLFGLAATRSGTLFDALTLGTLAYIVLVSAGPEAYCRFRVPLMPILAVYAAGGLGWAFRRPGRDRST